MMDDMEFAHILGRIEGKVDGMASEQTAMKANLTAHMEMEGRLMAGQDKRLRTVENKMYTTWIIGGGALIAAFTLLEGKIKTMLGIH